jgi:uncharacterized protein YcbX
MPVTVAELYIYPIKSARGIAVSALAFDARGAIGDRRWMLVDQDAQFLSQRRIARMTLLHVSLDADALVVDAPGMTTLTVPCDGRHEQSGERLVAGLFEDAVTVQRVGPEVDRWFTTFLRYPCSLVTMPEDTQRPVDLKYAPPGRTVAFADAFPALVLGTGSIGELNRRLAAKGEPPVSSNRFRPNIVVAVDEPHAEDEWRRLEGSWIAFDIVKPCARCSIPAIDPDRGVRGKEPTRTLSEYRLRDGMVFFGQNALHDRPGRLECGERLAVSRAAQTK